MTLRNCQNCGQLIGHLEESHSFYGRLICRACNTKLEKHFQTPETIEDDVKTDIPFKEVRSELNKDTRHETLGAEEEGASDYRKDIEYHKCEAPSGKDYEDSTGEVVNELSGQASKESITDLRTEAAYSPPLKQECFKDTSEVVVGTPGRRIGYLRRHWRGQQPLAISFWINLFLLNIIVYSILTYFSYRQPIENPVTCARVAVFCVAFVFVIVYPWQVIGLWRSSNHHIETTGKRFWARTAQAFVVLGLIGTTGNLNSSWPLYSDLFRLSFARDEFANYSIKLEKDNTLIHLQGGLGFGVSKEVAKLLKKYPEVRAIILDSQGGRIYEGRELSKLISTYGLDTYSFEGCYSAATIAFISGKHRFLGIGANLAFHQYSMSYKSLEPFLDTEEEQAKDLLIFRKQGVKNEFLDRLFHADSDDLWYPTVDEMVDAGVVHGIINPSDLLPVGYAYSSKEMAEADEVLLDIPFFKIIQKYEPETYRRIKAELNEQIEKGATQIEVQRAGARIIEPLAISVMRRTSDEALIQFYQIMLVALRKLREIDPILCMKALYPKQYGSISLTQYLSDDEVRSMMDIFSRIIVDAYEKDNSRVDAHAAELLLDRLLAELGDDVTYLELKGLQERDDYKRHCECVIKFYEMIVAKERAAAGNLLRYIMIPETDIEHQASPTESVRTDSNIPASGLSDLAIFADKWLESDHDANTTREN